MARTPYLCAWQVITYLREDNSLWDYNLFDYDYSTKRYSYNGCEFDPEIERNNFCLKYCVSVSSREFRSAIYSLSRKMSSRKPEEEKSVLTEYIEKWIEDTNPTEVSVLDVIKQCLNGKPLNYSQRSLEIRVGRSLKELGWQKIKGRGCNTWVRK